MARFRFQTRDIARELARKYSTMTLQELDILESIIEPMRYKKGETILAAGDQCEYIYYLDQGLIRQFYYKNDKEVTEYLASDHTIFMSIESLFKDIPSKNQIETLELSIIYGLPKSKLEEISLHYVNIQMLYRKILEESLIISQRRADLMRFENAQSRYEKLCKQEPQVVIRTPLLHIANYLQMTPETLSRVRAASLKG
ncbi:MAG: Crp/Fnr family transcriptional regulator [Prevotella sp.]|nr:Crp/Fnr family transcriptional regulator [Prevotella sp.]MCD8288317.1 Crp/Fnr family transcriptional regulator [Prevotella sp.]MCD8305880.1 Crp/Fnr family transcriptional regulator [Prevotella sp.]